MNLEVMTGTEFFKLIMSAISSIMWSRLNSAMTPTYNIIAIEMEDMAEVSLSENRRSTPPTSKRAHDLKLHLYREVSCSTFHLLFSCQQTS